MLLKLIRHPLFPFIFQVIALIVFLTLLLNGFNNVNIIPIIWKLWWPGLLVITTFFFGRLWCTVCPIELVNNLSHRLGRSFGLKGIRLPNWISAGWSILLFYLLLQVSVSAFKVNKIPVLTSLLLSLFFLLAIITGIIFIQPRAFCRGFCPAGILLKNYSRITPLQIYPISSQACVACVDKYCANPRYQNRFNNRSCPSLLKPYERSLGDDCNLCFQCVKICPYDNLSFGLIKPKVRQEMLRPMLFTCALYVFMESGFVLSEFLEGKIPEFSPYLMVGGFLLFLPFIFISLFWVISRLRKSNSRLSEFIPSLGLKLLPGVALAHVVKAMMEIHAFLF